MAEDRKFRFDHLIGQFVNRVSGEAIPHDEPVIIFRARDVHAIDVLGFYHGLIEDKGDPHHLRAVGERLDEFMAFRRDKPGRMKEPGITGDFELFSSRRTGNLHEGRRQESPLEERVDAIEHRDDVLERKMTDIMADIDTLNSILQGISNDAAALGTDFKNLEAELQAAQTAAANNQPIDLTNAILVARAAQGALDAIVAAAAPAAPADTGDSGLSQAGDTSGAADNDAGTAEQTGSTGADDTAEQAGEQQPSSDASAEQAGEQQSSSDQAGEQSAGFGGDTAEQLSTDDNSGSSGE